MIIQNGNMRIEKCHQGLYQKMAPPAVTPLQLILNCLFSASHENSYMCCHKLVTCGAYIRRVEGGDLLKPFCAVHCNMSSWATENLMGHTYTIFAIP